MEMQRLFPAIDSVNLASEPDVNPMLVAALLTLFFVNLVWPLLNLLPIWPLDGGQISREWFTYFTPRNGVRFSLHLSIAVSVLLAFHALVAWKTGRSIIPFFHDPLDILFFGMFAGIGYLVYVAALGPARAWADAQEVLVDLHREDLRKALGLDALSMGGGTGNSGPTVQAGRYVAPGVFVGAKQGTSGTSTQGLVQVDITKGLKLEGTVGTGSNTNEGATPDQSGGSSIGLKYQFEY